MRERLNLLNKTFEKLTVVKFANITNNDSYWLCKCDCGNIKVIRGISIKKGLSKSCGCLIGSKTCLGNKNGLRHGMTKTRFYSIWQGMQKRCFYKKNIVYKNYGGQR